MWHHSHLLCRLDQNLLLLTLENKGLSSANCSQFIGKGVGKGGVGGAQHRSLKPVPTAHGAPWCPLPSACHLPGPRQRDPQGTQWWGRHQREPGYPDPRQAAAAHALGDPGRSSVPSEPWFPSAENIGGCWGSPLKCGVCGRGEGRTQSWYRARKEESVRRREGGAMRPARWPWGGPHS